MLLATSPDITNYLISTSGSSHNYELQWVICDLMVAVAMLPGWHNSCDPAELHVGRCSIGFGLLENLYLDAKFAFLCRIDAKL